MNLEQAKLSLSELGDIDDPNSEISKRFDKWIYEDIEKQERLEKERRLLYGTTLKKS